MIPTYDLDGVATASFASFTLATGQSRIASTSAIGSMAAPSPGGFVLNGDGTARLTAFC
jgi:hypothetical protein